MNDPSFDINPKSKGSYVRRAQDINRALALLKIDSLSGVSAFASYYFCSEKLAKIIIGVENKEPASKIFGPNGTLKIQSLKKSCRSLNLPVSEDEIDWIFNAKCSGTGWDKLISSLIANGSSLKSARWLRNKLVHDIGPTHVSLIQKQEKALIPKMKKFLQCTEEIVEYLSSNSSANRDG